ncbi:MAG: response regulator [Chloroflexota bacterium]|nr:MAG: response regulator [Chloroflexota bacterium]
MAARTILIVDDAHDHRDILARLLRANGYRAIEAEPGEAALERAQAEAPDLILTALSLPGQPAWETARALRSLPDVGHTPILGVTMLTTLLSHRRVRALGCVDFVDKPFDLDGLLARIRELLPDPAPLSHSL